jgi:hypothetical protein
MHACRRFWQRKAIFTSVHDLRVDGLLLDALTDVKQSNLPRESRKTKRTGKYTAPVRVVPVQVLSHKGWEVLIIAEMNLNGISVRAKKRADEEKSFLKMVSKTARKKVSEKGFGACKTE